MTSAARTIRIVDPAAEIDAGAKTLAMAARLESLKGARIALIDNTKHMANRFLEATQTLLKSRYEVAGFEYYRKFSASVPTPPEVLDRLAGSCDALIHGVAD